MPRYQFHRLVDGRAETPPTEAVLFDDAVAMRVAIGTAFPEGCDVWQGSRFVGRFHRAAVEGAAIEGAAEGPAAE